MILPSSHLPPLFLIPILILILILIPIPILFSIPVQTRILLLRSPIRLHVIVWAFTESTAGEIVKERRPGLARVGRGVNLPASRAEVDAAGRTCLATLHREAR